MPLQLDDLNLLDAPDADGGGRPLLLPIDAIDEDPAQPRREFDAESLQELAETIAQRGVRQPVSVRRHPEHVGRWVLNFGARRLRASRLAGKAEIPAFVDETADSYDQVIENEHRDGLKPIELALFVKRELDAGRSQAEIARRLGKTRAYISYVCALVDPPDWLMALYRGGRCRGIRELYDLRRLHQSHGNAVLEWIGDRTFISRADIADLASRCNGNRPGETQEHEQGSARARADQGSAPESPSSTLGGKPQVRLNEAPEPVGACSHPVMRFGKRGFLLRADVDGVVVEVLLAATPEEGEEILVELRDGASRLVSLECIANLRIERS